MRIHGNQLLYEIHGPFEASSTQGNSRASRWQAALARVGGVLAGWMERWARHKRIRRATFDLARFDDRLLADIGLTRLDIEAAAAGVPLRERGPLAEPLQA
ncbi:MAG TPA: DUF1127 domain-containing protein [Bosea sp. (in: a-proteobacteria)]|jgi:uncharacterized protein YjiS (DUF1127 family)|uniref:DUF1127 domain-containing protein n=1 Tax=Bosea sp. (in: a-proteobacteria) TaxID=1871050 RepID=UPI002E11569C|nr:DUF1127 domain-containing protein [Bosea sp. (in: a-proteobacteria)]